MFPLRRSELTCPYCYQRFRVKEILFRCSGLPGRRKRCSTSVDHVLGEQMGEFEPKPPTFAADGRRQEAVHPECEAVTHYRLCPRCHSTLPVQYVEIDNRLIALVGAKESGKTVYMTVLLHELANAVGERFGASLLGADEPTRTRFEDDYEKQLYERHQLFGPTKSAVATAGGRRPLVFNFAVGRPKSRAREVTRTTLSFFDTAGEDMRSDRDVDQHVRYLSSADAIILLLDPLQLSGARPLADADALLPVEGRAADGPAAVLSRIIELLRARGAAHAQRKIDKPLAVAFTKMDALAGTLPEGNPLVHPPSGRPVFDDADGLVVHRYMQALLRDWTGHNIETSLANNFARYRFFGLSALGESPRLDEEGGMQRVSSPHGWRVEDPLLWLLAEFGVIDKAGRR
ncbi:hypothetical protein AB0M80_42405 [Amycolatopsis sp. NPDC051045]|uniref:TRAFAC clade GTPase domain-containing protein n=1 Tax=Amycolatopsis sp. NPDC051045 TaxID=3156922 RepID=UPI00343641DD